MSPDVKLADNITMHPKILRAGELLGGDSGRALAIAWFVESIGYARHHLTDGYLPDGFVSGSALGSGKKIASIFSNRSVQLWHKVRGGYRIHDFHDWNDKAVEIKQKREAERARVRQYRQRRNGGVR